MFEFEEILVALHLVGLCLAFGGVCVADFWGMRLLVTSNKTQALPTLEALHISISLGLALLVASGIAILNLRFNSLAAIPDKVWAKTMLVTILMLNGLYIQYRILPQIQRLGSVNI